jgi:sugar/nucleoside kinase (ribokinase family)
VTRALDALCMGEALWDLLAPPGRTFTDATTLSLEPGGAAVNVALALAGLGRATGLVATVGADALGDALVARLQARGVDASSVKRTSTRTGLLFGERAAHPKFLSYRDGEEVPVVPRSWSARVLLLTGVLPSEAQARSFGAAARAARRRRARVVVDLNARPRFWKGRTAAALEAWRAWLGEADVVKASEEDLAILRLPAPTLRAWMRERGVLVITAGPRPARAEGPFGCVEVSAPRRTKDASALGAGDAFTAGLLDALLRDDGNDRAAWEHGLRRGHASARSLLSSASRHGPEAVPRAPKAGR